MIRATNTIKHLDVKPRLFEEREEGEGGFKKTKQKKKNPDPNRESSERIKP